VDKLDIMILRELIDVPAASPAQTDIRKSLRKVAEKLGFSESAVRERVTRFRESGLLKGWIPFFNPSLFGLRVSGIWFDVNASSKEALLKKLQLMHGVMGIVNFFGSRVAMLVVYETTGAFRRELELIQRISETENLIQS
jgi:DNA-binding Lrp family transcriptional regulator